MKRKPRHLGTPRYPSHSLDVEPPITAGPPKSTRLENRHRESQGRAERAAALPVSGERGPRGQAARGGGRDCARLGRGTEGGEAGAGEAAGAYIYNQTEGQGGGGRFFLKAIVRAPLPIIIYRLQYVCKSCFYVLLLIAVGAVIAGR
jgi:hypothetical protein